MRGRLRPLGPPAGVSRAAGRIATVLIGLVAVGICGVILYKAPDGSMDFRTGIWQPAFDIAHGRAPYPDPDTLAQPERHALDLSAVHRGARRAPRAAALRRLLPCSGRRS